MWMLVVSLWIGMLISLVDHGSSAATASSGIRKRFEQRFMTTCPKYPFFHDFVHRLENPSDEYTIFVFHEPGSGSNGGLGDRLAGMISAFAFSMRTNRNFLVSGDATFEDLFQPFHPSLLLDKDSNIIISGKGKGSEFNWRDWSWSNWDRSYAQNMTFLKHCINPRPSNVACALDSNFASKVLKIRSNRCYLCRWGMKESLNLGKDLDKFLGVNRTVDLYEVAGCILRLSMWPTVKMWKELDRMFLSQFEKFNMDSINYQIGVHFRCGDSSMLGIHSAPNPQCVFTDNSSWHGTMFSDDKSLDSPLDLGNCVSTSLNKRPLSSTSTMVYIESDNEQSSQQIQSTLMNVELLRPPKACHLDLQSSLTCSASTIIQWFMLANSQELVVQSLIPVLETNYRDNIPSEEVATGPISAFSRFASIYSLFSSNMKFGRGCQSVNTHKLSWQTHGNWVCIPKMFY